MEVSETVDVDEKMAAVETDDATNTTMTTNDIALSVQEIEAMHKDSNSLLRQLQDRPNFVRNGDTVVLVFSDGRQLFAHCCAKKGNRDDIVNKHQQRAGVFGRQHQHQQVSLKINKRTYPTHQLIGLPYGSVLEVGHKQLIPLPPGEDLLPEFDASAVLTAAPDAESETFSQDQARDNRHIFDNNKSQALDNNDLQELRKSGADGSTIIQQIVENSATFDQKTDFSRAKYIARKQMKYQLRCRLVRATGASVCEVMFLKDAKRIMNMREDTLGQILSYANITAGCQTLVWDHCLGIVTGAVAQRMGGYGKQLCVYTGQQPTFTELLGRFNLSFTENYTIKWLHAGDLLQTDENERLNASNDEDKKARDAMEWPCSLQDHTRNYVAQMTSEKERNEFLNKRSARFARKITRDAPSEVLEWLHARPCDSIILAVRYDPTETLLLLLQYLAPSCPFVVYCEFIEPLTECFQELQSRNLAINLRLSDTWAREYQILPGRTHPSMNMSQTGGFLLSGIKLDEKFGRNELDEDLIKQIRSEIGGRRGRKAKKAQGDVDSTNQNGSATNTTTKEKATKKPRKEESLPNDTLLSNLLSFAL